MSSKIDWNDTIKKESRGVNNEDLGKVQEVTGGYVLVQRGIINKEKFYIPLDQAKSYDGSVPIFGISEDDIKSKYMSDMPPPQSSFTKEASSRVQRSEGQEEETKVPLTHEEVTIETRPPSGHTQAKEPVSSKEDITIPVKKEEISDVTKTPYVK